MMYLLSKLGASIKRDWQAIYLLASQHYSGWPQFITSYFLGYEYRETKTCKGSRQNKKMVKLGNFFQPPMGITILEIIKKICFPQGMH